MDPRRSERLSQAMREELEEMISYEMGDPRIDVQGVSDVLVSPDARQARVLLILTSDAKKQQVTIEALNNARGFLRAELGLSDYPHVLLRVGRAPVTPPTQRRRIEDVLSEQFDHPSGHDAGD